MPKRSHRSGGRVEVGLAESRRGFRARVECTPGPAGRRRRARDERPRNRPCRRTAAPLAKRRERQRSGGGSVSKYVRGHSAPHADRLSSRDAAYALAGSASQIFICLVSGIRNRLSTKQTAGTAIG